MTVTNETSNTSKTVDKNATNPNTGDNSNNYILLLLISLAGVCIARSKKCCKEE